MSRAFEELLTIRLSSQTLRKLERRAALLDRKPSVVGRQLIEKALDAEKGGTK